MMTELMDDASLLKPTCFKPDRVRMLLSERDPEKVGSLVDCSMFWIKTRQGHDYWSRRRDTGVLKEEDRRILTAALERYEHLKGSGTSRLMSDEGLLDSMFSPSAVTELLTATDGAKVRRNLMDAFTWSRTDQGRDYWASRYTDGRIIDEDRRILRGAIARYEELKARKKAPVVDETSLLRDVEDPFDGLGINIAELRAVIEGLTSDVSIAFIWSATRQGDAYWTEVYRSGVITNTHRRMFRDALDRYVRAQSAVPVITGSSEVLTVMELKGRDVSRAESFRPGTMIKDLPEDVPEPMLEDSSLCRALYISFGEQTVSPGRFSP